ncbi:MAG: FMN-binding protein [Propionicimonas sp.]
MNRDTGTVPASQARAGRARLFALAAAVGVVAFSGCAQSVKVADYPDGEYRGVSAPDDAGAVGNVEFTISGGRVTQASFVVVDPDGTPHDQDYGLSKATGKPVDEAFYQRAQAAVKAEQQYVTRFKEVGDADQVDVIAGASLSHRQFVEAITDALSHAG